MTTCYRSSGRWGIGNHPLGGGATGEPYAGTIYMARAYSAVLTAAQIRERWARGMALYRGL